MFIDNGERTSTHVNMSINGCKGAQSNFSFVQTMGILSPTIDHKTSSRILYFSLLNISISIFSKSCPRFFLQLPNQMFQMVLAHSQAAETQLLVSPILVPADHQQSPNIRNIPQSP
jgi:hypothetical protein